MVAFVASTVLTAANLNTAFNALTIRTVTLTSDTLVLADNGGAVTYSNASATTSTIPPNSSVAYAVGTKIILANLGAGVVTVTPGAGVAVAGFLSREASVGVFGSGLRGGFRIPQGAGLHGRGFNVCQFESSLF